MPRFVVYEVWTCHYIVDAADEESVYDEHEPSGAISELSLCNWHAVEIPEPTPKPILGLVQKGER